MAGISKTAIFNVSLAALAGAAGGFAVFAMPRDLLEGLIGVTGLPNMFTAAQPPLGTTARLCLVGMASLSLFLLIWLVLRAFDAPPATASKRTAQNTDDQDDDWYAPAPREIRAPAPRPQPLRATELDEMHLTPADIVPPPPIEDTFELHSAHIAAFEPVVQPASAPAWDDEVEWDPAPLHVKAEAIEEEASTNELLSRLPSSRQQASSVASLVQRLNAGLAESDWPIEQEEAETDPTPEMDDRLRGVLHDLHKMAGRTN